MSRETDDIGCLWFVCVLTLVSVVVLMFLVSFIATENERQLNAIEANVRIILKHERNAAMRPLARPEGIER